MLQRPATKSRLLLFLLVLVCVVFVLFRLDDQPSPILGSAFPSKRCRINLVHLIGDGASSGSKPIVLSSYRESLDWGRKYGLLTYEENAPVSQWNTFDLNFIVNFACSKQAYRPAVDFSAVLVPSLFEQQFPFLRENPLNYSNVALWYLAWDQVSPWGCPGDYFYEMLVRNHESEMRETMKQTLLAGEVSHHYSILTPMSTQKPIIVPTLVPLDTFPSVDELQEKRRDEFRGTFYIKHPLPRHRSVIPLLHLAVLRRGLPYDTFVYGGYKEEDFRASIERASFFVAVDDHEIFGNAIQRVKGYDVPIFTISNSLRQGWFSQECGEFVSCAHLLPFDELDGHFARFLDRVKDGGYSPRQWVADHITAEHIFPNTVQSLCNRYSPIFEGDETEAGVAFEEECPQPMPTPSLLPASLPQAGLTNREVIEILSLERRDASMRARLRPKLDRPRNRVDGCTAFVFGQIDGNFADAATTRECQLLVFNPEPRTVRELGAQIIGIAAPLFDQRPVNDQWPVMSPVEVFKVLGNQHVDMMRIDCKGCEYALAPYVARDDPQFWHRVDSLALRINMSTRLAASPLHVENLAWLFKQLKDAGLRNVGGATNRGCRKVGFDECPEQFIDAGFGCMKKCVDMFFERSWFSR